MSRIIFQLAIRVFVILEFTCTSLSVRKRTTRTGSMRVTVLLVHASIISVFVSCVSDITFLIGSGALTFPSLSQSRSDRCDATHERPPRMGHAINSEH